MVAMAFSISSNFVNSLWGRPRLCMDAILSVDRGVPVDDAAAVALAARTGLGEGSRGSRDKSGYPDQQPTALSGGGEARNEMVSAKSQARQDDDCFSCFEKPLKESPSGLT